MLCWWMLFWRFRIPLLVFIRLDLGSSGYFTTAHDARLASKYLLLILVLLNESCIELVGLLIGDSASHGESGEGLSLDHFC